MHIHILGICGTFMAGLASIARAAGHRVTGADKGVYPPMSDQLAALGIDVVEGYEADQLSLDPDVIIVGNVMTRGMPVVEEMLNRRMNYASGPDWLAREVLRGRRVVGVAGTHGKTTTTSLLAWILESAGQNPGFLIGGVPANFGVSARLGGESVFVIEADEYDTAFFDKRAKFLHYRPETQIITNLEFDHADIYANLDEIQWQFHQLLRALPGNGLLIVPAHDENIRELIGRGCWTPVETFASLNVDANNDGGGADWTATSRPAGKFGVFHRGVEEGVCNWSLTGAHNAENAIAAILAARQLGVSVRSSLQALGQFAGVKRRLELRGTFGGVSLYDDFAHHPTAIRRTIAGLRAEPQHRRLLIVLEPRSNSMKLGIHRETLAASLSDADQVWVYRSDDLEWDLVTAMAVMPTATVCEDIDTIVDEVARSAQPGDAVVIMSNGGFFSIHECLEQALRKKFRDTG